MIQIRRADKADLNQIAPLFDAYRVFYRKESNLEHAKDFLNDRLNNKESIIYIAVDNDNNTCVGFTQIYPTFSSTQLKKSLILNDLFVDEKYRGRGISKKLIDASKSYCIETKANGILLETEKTNIIGNKLYPSQNFEKETHNFYFWKNE